MGRNLEFKNDTSFELSSTTSKSFITIGKLENFRREIKTEMLIIQLNDKNGFLANNNYTVSISFYGRIKDDNSGLYRTSYLDEENSKRYKINF